MFICVEKIIYNKRLIIYILAKQLMEYPLTLQNNEITGDGNMGSADDASSSEN